MAPAEAHPTLQILQPVPKPGEPAALPAIPRIFILGIRLHFCFSLLGRGRVHFRVSSIRGKCSVHVTVGNGLAVVSVGRYGKRLFANATSYFAARLAARL